MVTNTGRKINSMSKSSNSANRYCRAHSLLAFLFAGFLILSGCAPQTASFSSAAQPANVAAQTQPSDQAPAEMTLTPFPTRPAYQPGELVDYTAQTGDTLPALAAHFNTTVQEILQANTFIPKDATTMPPGMPMKIPIYYQPLWGSPYHILPDSLFINGPAQVGFSTVDFVNQHPGWLKDYTTYASGANRSGAEVVNLIAEYYSVSPRLLLALLEYQAGALSKPELPASLQDYPLGYRSWDHKGVYLQLGWAANLLNNAYYGWSTGTLSSIEYPDGSLERFDPWQNAATVSLHNYFNTVLPQNQYAQAISPDGFVNTYTQLFGDPWQADQPQIPGSLTQPDFKLPFQPGALWAFTGGPHTGWGKGAPFAALDFAPPTNIGGCTPTDLWATAVADGVVARSETGMVVLDLDGDGDERTGWDVFYLHIGTDGRVAAGTQLKQGDPIGHPSCEGGESTGTHVHLARKYNGEWLPASGTLGFNLEGWVAHSSGEAYKGYLQRYGSTITACECSNQASFIQSGTP
jgi:LasA protease